jgi:hypothetical protein
MAELKRNYDNNYPSVTTILGVLRKIGLEMWFKFNTAKFCTEESEKGKLIGTQIHEGIETFINTGEIKVKTEYAEEVTNALKGFVEFRKAYPEIKLSSSEVMMTSEIYHYNGTLDCVAEENGTAIILDWKTGQCKKKDKPDIYDEYKYQVSAYVKAYNEINKTDIKKAIILSLAKDRVAYNLYIMEEQEINDCFNEAFLPALKIYNYQQKQKGAKVG